MMITLALGLSTITSVKKKCGRLPSPSDVGLTKVFERVCLYGAFD